VVVSANGFSFSDLSIFNYFDVVINDTYLNLALLPTLHSYGKDDEVQALLCGSSLEMARKS